MPHPPANQPTPAQPVKAGPNTMDLKAAKQSATSLSKETPTVPVEQLPADLCALLDGTPDDYKILGFDTGKSGHNQYRLDGKVVHPHYEVGHPWTSPNQQIEYWATKNEKFRAPGKKLAKHRFVHEWVEETTWFAIVIGNAVTCETALKVSGFPAFAGSGSYVQVRPATELEIASYISPT